VATASNFNFGPTDEPRTGDDRPWIAALAATGWVALTTITVLLATGVWDVPGNTPTTDQPAVAPASCRTAPSAAIVPQPRTTLPRTTQPRPVLPRAPQQQTLDRHAVMALIPRQVTQSR
jgi:hypothetical protein